MQPKLPSWLQPTATRNQDNSDVLKKFEEAKKEREKTILPANRNDSNKIDENSPTLVPTGSYGTRPIKAVTVYDPVFPSNAFQDDSFATQYEEVQIGTSLAVNPKAPDPVLENSHLVGRIAISTAKSISVWDCLSEALTSNKLKQQFFQTINTEDSYRFKRSEQHNIYTSPLNLRKIDNYLSLHTHKKFTPFLAKGILIGPDLFLTTSHYCKTSSAFISKIKIQLETPTPLDAELVFGGFTQENDFAIFRLSPSTPNPYLNNETHRHFATIGSGSGQSELHHILDCPKILPFPPPQEEATLSTKPGDSGSPGFNTAGDLIGIYSYIEDDLNWFITLEKIFFCLHDYSQDMPGDTDATRAKRAKVKALYKELRQFHPELAKNPKFQLSSLSAGFEDRPSSLPPSVLDPSESKEIFLEYKRRFEPISLRQEFHGGGPLDILASVRSGKITQEQLNNDANLNQRYQQGLDIERNKGIKANANNPVVELTPLPLQDQYNSLETLYNQALNKGILQELTHAHKDTIKNIIGNKQSDRKIMLETCQQIFKILYPDSTGGDITTKDHFVLSFPNNFRCMIDGQNRGNLSIPKNKPGTQTYKQYNKQAAELISHQLKALFRKNNYILE